MTKAPNSWTRGRVVAPSLLAADFSRLAECVVQLQNAGADWLHLDVMDGCFVPNISFGVPVIAPLRPLTDLPFDCHLMIDNPETYLSDFADAGADHILVHVEATHHLNRCLEMIADLGCKAGVALNPATPIDVLDHVLDQVSLILIMTVNPGFGGQSFIHAMLPKISAMRARIGDRPIRLEVDGGINVETAPLAIAAGADTLVAGSAILGEAPETWGARIKTIRG